MLNTAHSNDHTLVLFYKFPKPKFGKQRLAVSIGADAACNVGQKLLDCAFEDMSDWTGKLVFAPANAESATASKIILDRFFANRAYEFVLQGEGNLGERLNRIDGTLRAQGHTHIHYIGSDAPILSRGIYNRARQEVDRADYALADSRDGGVTLMAASKSWPDMSGLPWSTDQLGGALAEACGAGGFVVERFDGLYDVDELRDLRDINRDLVGDDRPARKALIKTIDAILTETVPARGTL